MKPWIIGTQSTSNAFAELIGQMANDNSKIAIRTFITYNHDTGYIRYAIIQNIVESGTNYLEVFKILNFSIL